MDRLEKMHPCVLHLGRLAPIQLRIGRKPLALEKRPNTEASEDHRRRGSLPVHQRAKRPDVQVVVMIVADEDDVDSRKTVDKKAGGRGRLQSEDALAD